MQKLSTQTFFDQILHEHLEWSTLRRPLKSANTQTEVSTYQFFAIHEALLLGQVE